MLQVLVVHGCTEERRHIVEALSRVEGVTVRGSIPDLETAARVLARYVPDVLVTGTELADGDGIRLVERARSRRGMWIVVVGPATSRDVWLRYLEAGADRFVEPDPELEELQDVVRALVEQLGTAHTDGPSYVTGPVAINIARDFNNHLRALEALLELLERSPGDTQLWSGARGTLARTARLTQSLLGHIGEPRPGAATLDFSELVRSAAQLARNRIAPRVEVLVEIADPLPRVVGVASELERMVLELVMNASESSEDGGQVRIVVAQAAGAVLLAVTNDGAGLRGSRAALDLETPRAIVERHRGTLLVATCEPVNSSVLVTLPVPVSSSC